MRLPFVCLVFYIPTAQRICAISSYTDKNSRRSSAKLSACCFACFARKRINEHSFRAFLYTVFAHSKTELESQGDDRSERRAFVAHKLLLLQPQQVAVVRLGSLCSSSHTAKTSLSSLIYKHKFACFCRAGALVCVVQATAPCCCVAGAQMTMA